MKKRFGAAKLLSGLLVTAMLLSSGACGKTGDPSRDAEASLSDGSSADADASSFDGTPSDMESIPSNGVSSDAGAFPSEGASSDTGSASEDSSGESEENGAHYPVTVTDQAGRKVTIAEEPQRLVSGYYISTSLLIALGLEEKLVGIEAKSGSRPIYSLSAPALLELPNVGSAKEFDLEGCAALEPDLVILPGKLKEAAGTLEELGFPVLLVNPENQELLTEMIRIIGEAAGAKTRAQALLDFTNAQEERLEQLLAGADAPSVYLAGNSSLLSTAGSAMYQSDLIRRAGGANAAAEIEDTYWAEIDYEQLLHWNPEYIITASDADYTVEDVLSDPNLKDCAAVTSGNVYQMPGRAEAWDSPVPGGILGTVWLSSILHPDLCPESDSASIIEEYYETFYGFSYSES